MGEAKNRGTFEERKSLAIKLNSDDQRRKDNEADIMDAKRGRYHPNGRINPTLMGLYLSAMAKKGIIQ
jgi:hypothetical protein